MVKVGDAAFVVDDEDLLQLQIDETITGDAFSWSIQKYHFVRASTTIKYGNH